MQLGSVADGGAQGAATGHDDPYVQISSHGRALATNSDDMGPISRIPVASNPMQNQIWVNQVQAAEEASEEILQSMLANGAQPGYINALRAKGMGK